MDWIRLDDSFSAGPGSGVPDLAKDSESSYAHYSSECQIATWAGASSFLGEVRSLQESDRVASN